MPEHPDHIRVTGPSHCPVAQSAELYLALLGRAVQRRIGPRPHLVVRQNPGILQFAEGGPAIFDLIARLHPQTAFWPDEPDRLAQHRALIQLAFAAAPALEQVIAARNLRDLDLAVHALRGLLLRIEDAVPDARLDDASWVDAALLPLFWRIALLDLRHQAHLGDGLLHWTRRSGGSLRDPRFVAHFDRAAGRQFLDRLVRHGSALACDPRDEDWDRAFAALVVSGRAARPAMPPVAKINDIHYQLNRV